MLAHFRGSIKRIHTHQKGYSIQIQSVHCQTLKPQYHYLSVWDGLARDIEPNLVEGNILDFLCTISYSTKGKTRYTNFNIAQWRLTYPPLKPLSLSWPSHHESLDPDHSYA